MNTNNHTKETTPYIQNAQTATISNTGNAKKIEATIGIKLGADNVEELYADIKKNATGQEKYVLIDVPANKMNRLTLIPGLMRAVPWVAVDPPDPQPLDWIANAIVSALQEIYGALVNTLTAAMRTIISVAEGVAATIAEGARLIAAGIMAIANFVAKLFKDALTMLIEFGQWLIGVLGRIVGKFVRILKFVLGAVARFLARIIGFVIYSVGALLKSAVERIGLGIEYSVGYLKISSGAKRFVNLLNINMNLLINIVNLYVDALDIMLPFMNVSIVIVAYDRELVINMLTPILAGASLMSTSTPEGDIRNETKFVGNILDGIWQGVSLMLPLGFISAILFFSGINVKKYSLESDYDYS